MCIVDQEEIDVQEGRMHILHLFDTSLDQSMLEQCTFQNHITS